VSYLDEAKREVEQSEVFQRWLTSRIETVHDRITAADVLSRYGVKLQYDGNRAEQVFCPFHGNTRTQAARYHPADAKSPDHVWCFVCNKRWDCIGLYREFEALGEGAKFSAVLRGLERAYGILPPEVPSVIEDEPDRHELDKIEEDFAACEMRLKNGRKAFDMKGYLTVGSILDRLRWQFTNEKIKLPALRQQISLVKDKIGEKVRACPDD
jgi:hypothetical protein